MKLKPNSQRGASILEFAVITAPFLILLAWTALEFGVIFVRTNTLTKSVQDAARYLSDTHDDTDSSTAQTKKETIARNLVVYENPMDKDVNGSDLSPILPGLSTTDVTIGEDTSGDHVIVSVVYSHVPLLGQGVSTALEMVTGATIDLSIDLPASSVMRYVQ